MSRSATRGGAPASTACRTARALPFLALPVLAPALAPTAALAQRQPVLEAQVVSVPGVGHDGDDRAWGIGVAAGVAEEGTTAQVVLTVLQSRPYAQGWQTLTAEAAHRLLRAGPLELGFRLAVGAHRAAEAEADPDPNQPSYAIAGGEELRPRYTVNLEPPAPAFEHGWSLLVGGGLELDAHLAERIRLSLGLRRDAIGKGADEVLWAWRLGARYTLPSAGPEPE